MNRLVPVEILKLRTTPAAWVTLALTLVLTIVTTLTTILLAGRPGAAPLGSVENVSKVLAIGALTSTVMLTVGILVMAGENRHRTIVGSYLAEPRRGRVLVAKMIVTSAFGAVLGALAFGLVLAVAVPLYAAKGVTHLPVDITSLWLGTVLVSACYGLLGVALGAVTRNTVAAVVGAVLWVQLVEVGLLQSLAPSLAKWLPTGAGVALTRAGHGTAHLLPPAAAALVLIAWAAVLATAASRSSLRRDVA